jgi:hypothetical protein
LKKYKVGSIKTGDLIFYSSNCLALFYKNFSTSYRYAELGAIEDVSRLTAGAWQWQCSDSVYPHELIKFPPHLRPETPASLAGEYRFSRLRVPHLVTKSLDLFLVLCHSKGKF